MFYAIGTVAALDQAQDVESDREIDVERLDIGVGGGYRAADLGGIYRILGLENPVSVVLTSTTTSHSDRRATISSS